jgi:FkbM family methyltransferase
MGASVETAIPGRRPIELVAFYEEFRWYYPQCELETKRWFVENIEPDWWIFDVGANIGYYTILFAQLGHRGCTIAFEPTVTAKMLRANLEHHRIQNTEVHEIALGATTGARQDRIFRLWGAEGEERTYQFSTLDDFVDRRKPERVDCIKIDVDSFDFDVLRGAEKTLLKYDPVIVIELNGTALAKRQQYPSEPLTWLAQRGYRKALILDRENFVLQRKQRAFSGLPTAGSIELVFPRPHRVDEKLMDLTDRPMAAPIIKAAMVVDGSTIKPHTSDTAPSLGDGIVRHIASRWSRFRRKREERPSSDLPPDLQSLIGLFIETSATAWSYALIIELASQPPGGKLAVEVVVEVSNGKLGVMFDGDASLQLHSHERTLSAMPGVQRVVLTAPTALARSLVFRTASFEGTKTTFRLKNIKGRVDML